MPAGWRSPIYDFIAGRAVCHDGAAKPVHREKCIEEERERERESQVSSTSPLLPVFFCVFSIVEEKKRKKRTSISVPFLLLLLLLLLLLFQMDIAKKSAFLSYSFFPSSFFSYSSLDRADIEYSTEDLKIVRSSRISFEFLPPLPFPSRSSPLCLLSHSRGAIRSLSGRCLRFSAIARGEPVVLHLDRIRILLLSLSLSLFTLSRTASRSLFERGAFYPSVEKTFTHSRVCRIPARRVGYRRITRRRDNDRGKGEKGKKIQSSRANKVV